MKLKQVLCHLVGNALSSMERGTLFLHFEKDEHNGNLIKVRVKDTGVGMDIKM